MKYIYQRSLICVMLLLGAINTRAQTVPSTFTLQASIDYAKENNPNLKNARAAITASEARIGELVASGLPQINASADLSNNYIIPTSFLPAKAFDPSAGDDDYIGVKFGTAYSGRASINLEQMIFNGSYFVGLKASKTYAELARKDLISSEIDVVAAIKKAYYSVLVNQERLSLVEKNVQRLDSLLRETKALYENGFAEKIDVNRVQVQYNNIVNTKKNSSIGVEVSYNLLKFQMGVPIQEQIALSDELETIELQVLDDDLRKDFTYSNRIEYSKLEVNHSLVELDIKNTKSQYLPTLDLYGNYGTSYGTQTLTSLVAFGPNWRSFGTYGIRASLPIFDGLRKSKQVQQKRVQLTQIENNLTLVKNQIDLEQEQTSLTFTSNIETLKAQKENMDLSQEVYEVSVIKYQQGVGSNIEVMNADASYKEAQTNYYAALFDALISSVDLEKSYGKVNR